MTEMLHAVRDALGNYNYLCLYGFAILFLLIFFKGKRKAFIIPAVLLSIGVLNPFFFKLWNKINDYAYWRTIWMIPVIPACAAVPALLVEKGKKTWIKTGAVIAATVVFILAGTWIGNHELTRFRKPDNVEKLPAGAVAVADALLELDETPYVVADNDTCIYLRQYSGRIHTMYARDVYFGESDAVASNVFVQLSSEEGNLKEAAQTLLNCDYEYLIAKNPDSERQQALSEAGFESIRQVNEYIIYRVNGRPTEIRTYNERHQIIALTYVDENGEPVNGPEGYAKRTFEYDKWGRIIRQFQTDADGNGVPGEDGTAGYEVTFDRFGHIIREVLLGTNGAPVDLYGYITKTAEYKWKKLVSEHYYDIDGNPAVIGPGYTKCIFEYTKDGEISLIRYLDSQDQQVEAGSAYFHEYLQSLKERDISIFISARDEASRCMTVTLCEDMKELGIQTDLRDQFRKSFYAVVTPDGVQEDLSDEEISCSGMLGEIPYTVISAGNKAGCNSSIMIDGKEYSNNERGLNIVIFDNASKKALEAISFDTFKQDMKVTRNTL